MIRIYGASDDLVEIECPGRDDELGCYDERVEILVGWPEASAGEPSRGLSVVMTYEGVWSPKLSLLDDGAPLPWPVAIKVHERGYSLVVEIDAPDDTPIQWRVGKLPGDEHAEWGEWLNLGDRSMDDDD